MRLKIILSNDFDDAEADQSIYYGLKSISCFTSDKECNHNDASEISKICYIPIQTRFDEQRPQSVIKLKRWIIAKQQEAKSEKTTMTARAYLPSMGGPDETG